MLHITMQLENTITDLANNTCNTLAHSHTNFSERETGVGSGGTDRAKYEGKYAHTEASYYFPGLMKAIV